MPHTARINVLLVLRMAGFGGTERQVVELCRAIDKTRFAVTVALFFEAEGYGADLRAAGVCVRVLATRQDYMWKVWLRLWRLMREKKIDVVHTFLPIANMVGVSVARLSGCPQIIAGLRNADPFSWRSIFCWMDLYAFRLAHVVVANAPVVGLWAQQYYGVNRERVRVIPNGRKEPVPARSRAETRRSLGLTECDIMLLAVGRVTEQKGHIYLVRALAAISKNTHQSFKLVIAGRLEEAHVHLLAEVQAMGLSAQVIFTGASEIVADLLGAADIFVFPSLWEGMPNALMEAMLMGLPLVVTDIAAHHDLIQHEIHGLIVPVRDAAALADAVACLAHDPDLARSLGQAARRLALAQFSTEALARAHESLYERKRG